MTNPQAHTPKLIIFDLDGTLAESKQPLTPEMGKLLAQLLQTRFVAVMSGAGLPQFNTQFLAHLPKETKLERLYLFPDSAAQCFTYSDENGVTDWHTRYNQSFSQAERARVLEALESALTEVGLQTPPERLWGERTEDRGGEIAFSPLGQHAPVAEKQAWHEAHEGTRQKLRDLLAQKLPDFAVTTGGITTIDITRKGVTKAYGVAELAKITGIPVTEILYVGDALGPGGNDAVVLQTGVPTHAVRGPSDTEALLKNLLTKPTPMHTKRWLLGVLLVLIVGGVGFLALTQTRLKMLPYEAPQPAKLEDLIVVDTPLPTSAILYNLSSTSTTLEISGKARGNWFFEATAPVELKDASGAVIASGTIRADGDWMTTEYVPFHTILTIPLPMPEKDTILTLVLKNDNPSGDPTKQKELDISIRFRDRLDLP